MIPLPIKLAQIKWLIWYSYNFLFVLLFSKSLDLVVLLSKDNNKPSPNML